MKLLICTQAVDKHDPILGFFHGWVEEFAKQCEHVDVICLREGEHTLPANVRVFTLGKLHSEESVFGDRLRHIRRFLWLVLRRSWGVDAVFVHMNPEYVILGAWLWKLLRKRIVLWYVHKSVTLKLRLARRLVTNVCTASPESFRLKGKNVIVTGHGIDTDLFAIPRTAPVDFLRIVTVGRISRAKGLHIMVDTMPLLPKRGVPYRFTIVGGPVTKDDEQYHEELRTRIRDNQVGDFVTFVGTKEGSEVGKVLASSDVFLHASETGSLDKAVLEAMAERCVVISSNDATRPILREIHHALAVTEPGAELFADSIQRIDMMDDGERLAIGEALRKIVVSDHSLRHLVTKIIWILKGNK